MGDKVQQFLRDIHSNVDQEPLTAPWFALRCSSIISGIFGNLWHHLRSFPMQKPGTPMTEVLVVGISCRLGFCMKC